MADERLQRRRGEVERRMGRNAAASRRAVFAVGPQRRQRRRRPRSWTPVDDSVSASTSACSSTNFSLLRNGPANWLSPACRRGGGARRRRRWKSPAGRRGRRRSRQVPLDGLGDRRRQLPSTCGRPSIGSDTRAGGRQGHPRRAPNFPSMAAGNPKDLAPAPKPVRWQTRRPPPRKGGGGPSWRMSGCSARDAVAPGRAVFAVDSQRRQRRRAARRSCPKRSLPVTPRQFAKSDWQSVPRLVVADVGIEQSRTDLAFFATPALP